MVLLNHLHEFFVNSLSIKSILDVLSILMSDVLTNSLDKGLADRHDNSECWSLSHLSLDLASHID